MFSQKIPANSFTENISISKHSSARLAANQIRLAFHVSPIIRKFPAHPFWLNERHFRGAATSPGQKNMCNEPGPFHPNPLIHKPANPKPGDRSPCHRASNPFQ
jgi:hypothetical protein